MDFDVYCDESRPDVLCSHKTTFDYLVIGSLWLPREHRGALKAAIHELRDKHKIGGEFKWKKISPSRVAFYEELASLFFGAGDLLRFRCIAVDRRKINLQAFHNNDQELGFYKFYYQLLHHWIQDNNDYQIFCDHKINRDMTRLPVLRQCLAASNLLSNISAVQAVRSHEAVLLQFTDILTGAASARINQSLKEGTSKTVIVAAIEKKLGRPIAPTTWSEQKFNLFKINPGGGW